MKEMLVQIIGGMTIEVSNVGPAYLPKVDGPA
jgi:hypothetical protein